MDEAFGWGLCAGAVGNGEAAGARGSVEDCLYREELSRACGGTGQSKFRRAAAVSEAPSSVIAPRRQCRIPALSQRVDFEGELAV